MKVQVFRNSSCGALQMGLQDFLGSGVKTIISLTQSESDSLVTIVVIYE